MDGFPRPVVAIQEGAYRARAVIHEEVTVVGGFGGDRAGDHHQPSFILFRCCLGGAQRAQEVAAQRQLVGIHVSGRDDLDLFGLEELQLRVALVAIHRAQHADEVAAFGHGADCARSRPCRRKDGDAAGLILDVEHVEEFAVGSGDHPFNPHQFAQVDGIISALAHLGDRLLLQRLAEEPHHGLEVEDLVLAPIAGGVGEDVEGVVGIAVEEEAPWRAGDVVAGSARQRLARRVKVGVAPGIGVGVVGAVGHIAVMRAAGRAGIQVAQHRDEAVLAQVGLAQAPVIAIH